MTHLLKNKRNSKAQESIKPAIYIRVSTSEQADSGLGLDSQIARCSAMAVAKNWNDPVIYRDEGISGTKDRTKRPGFDALLTDVEQGKINAVIVLDLSRLARKTGIVLSTIELLEKKGAQFISVKEGFDTSTAQGKFVLTMFAALGELERDLISERTKDALNERDKAHNYKAGRLPFGYKRNVEKDANGKIRSESIYVDSEQAQHVQRIFALRAESKSLRVIAAHMDTIVASPNGSKWSAETVRIILGNEHVYRGNVDMWPSILQ